MKFEYYDISPFDLKDRVVINEIIKYIQEMNNFTNKIYLVTSLGVKGFDEAVPYLIELYKQFINLSYNKPFDEMLILYM